MFAQAAGNHLWQSTLCVAVAWLLTLALRKNRASVRYGLWLAASVKFLVPFSWLAALGASLHWQGAPVAEASRLPVFAAQIEQPFAMTAPVAFPAAVAPAPHLWHGVLLVIWLCGIAVGVVFWIRSTRRISAILRGAKPLDLNLPIPVMAAPGRMEPGVFGISKPALLLPEGIAEHLTPEQLEAILAHELRHVHRRDNLTAAIHILVETLFWFHPAVWWIRTRLVEERERACDEGVLLSGSEPQVYAESILKVCEFYLSAPVASAAGMTGGELKKRIEGIMTNHALRNLSVAKRMLLAAVALAVVVFPVVLEIARAQAQAGSERPRFAVVSVKQDHTGEVGGAGDWLPGTHGPSTGSWRWTRIDALRIVADAYDVKWNQVVGVPKMLQGPATVFNIDARFPAGTTTAQFRLMLQSLLADRFHFSMHRETRELPAIAIEVAKGGPKLKPASGDCAEHPAKSPPDEYRCGVFTVLLHAPEQGAPDERVWEYAGRSVSMADIAAGFMQNDPVVDATGLRGLYDIDVKIQFRPTPESNDPDERLNSELDFDANFRSSFEKQAGLTVDLGSRKRLPVPVVVVDRMEMPTPN